jgi:arabinogalactan endo-1,4-beta-galactosidase
MRLYTYFLLLIVSLVICSCSKKTNPAAPTLAPDLYLGADLSYINEIENCGAVYRQNGQIVDPYTIFSDKSCNLVRLRLWHNPTLSGFSNYNDVKRSMQRAKGKNMPVLLDFHYSDTWADPGNQAIPAAWASITNVTTLGDSVYNYTLNTLLKLGTENLTPSIVQVGNEINSEVLQPNGQPKYSINWTRNAQLINRGIQGVREASRRLNKHIEVMLHIAQPENALWWFQQATAANLTDFDWIGISYYPLWSNTTLENLPTSINTLITTHRKKLMVVETAYPFTLQNADGSTNILGQNALLSGYPATPEGQKNYMIQLVKQTLAGGGKGVIYWEPAWVANTCTTPWATGSAWDNATFFNSQNQNEALPVFDFFNQANYR